MQETIWLILMTWNFILIRDKRNFSVSSTEKKKKSQPDLGQVANEDGMNSQVKINNIYKDRVENL